MLYKYFIMKYIGPNCCPPYSFKLWCVCVCMCVCVRAYACACSFYGEFSESDLLLHYDDGVGVGLGRPMLRKYSETSNVPKAGHMD